MAQQVVVGGVDPHKLSLTVGVVDPAGGEVDTASFANTVAGVAAAVGCLAGWTVQRVGVEGSSGHGRHLAAALVGAGYDVREVPARRTAARRRARRRAKTDVEDALAIARATAGEAGLGPVKPGAGLGLAHEELVAVRAHRDMLVARRQVMLNRGETGLGGLPLAMIGGIGAGRAVLPRLRAAAALDPAGQPAPVAAQLVMLRELHADIVELARRIAGLGRRMGELIEACGCTLLSEEGIGVIGAATLLSEVGDPARFRDEAAFNRWCGIAPVAISSGEGHGHPLRHRLDLLGNRAVNSVLYTMSITQARHYEPARTYLAAKISQGHSKKEARRAHKSLLARRVIRRMWADRRRALERAEPAASAAA